MFGEASPVDPSNPAFWTSIGIGGLFVVAFIRGWIVPGYVLDRAEQRIKTQDEKLDRMTEVFERDMIPALNKSTEANETVYEYIMGQAAPRKPTTRKR